MFKRSVSNRGIFRAAIASLGLAVIMSSLASGPAEARRWRRHHPATHHRVAAYTPAFAAIVVDANSGKTLYARNENELRHPASVTKVMTLYMLFEQLEKGRYRLDSEIPISAHAARQAPSKLGLRPGETIAVEDAIKALVTKSANDIAVAVAEAVGGDEETFAEQMTRKARSLGMTRTVYRNASGLPDDEQVTTARDLAILGRAVQERFPRYYKYFSTHVFYYDGGAHRNHNHLLGRVEGMDGIKTGYTRKSGFNLLTSVKRDGHHIVSVVLGGKSARGRDQIMANLIEEHLDGGSTRRSATMVAENEPVERQPDAFERREIERARIETERERARAQRPEPAARTESVKPESVKPEPVRVAAYSAPMQLTPPVAMPAERPRPAYVSGAPKPAPVEDRPLTTATIKAGKRVVLDGSTRAVTASAATATPSQMRWIAGKQPTGAARTAAVVAKAEPPRAAAKTESVKTNEAAGRPANHGWMIQIGATDDAGKANELLARAKSNGHSALASARPFTEKVQKGSETLYRARFAGLQADSAEAACKTLKRSGMSCFATRN
jgi:D-alanyl-D-alanine carboxypeptidase